MISNKERKRRQHEKELNSLRNKMGSNIAWFDSLGKTKQYDVLFGWKRQQRMNKLKNPEYVWTFQKVPIDPKRPWGRKKIVKVLKLKYPPSLKHFIKDCMANPSLKPQIQNLRQATIELLFKN